ncbi:MAG TPA: tRNA (guanosine(46)-N7)-methyltransferase TrmB [Firmicutes bacterium]|nr:tRNA (guanosine(46)-N7)-methyltransferase TrmB [Bacillota bacterium]
MRLRNVKNAREIVDNSSYVIHNPQEYRGGYANKIFKNSNPIHLEIGMGKGNFIIDKAKKNPNINFIGIERYESVMCRALEKLDNVSLPNLRFICIDAAKLGDVFCNEIETIYLNFSDPWPKKRHAKRRLTSSLFLNTYDKIFLSDAIIIQKTDNVGLFESSIINLSIYGYKIFDISLDLAAREDIDNSLTEYEEKFMNQGVKINYLKAIKKN